MDVQKIPFGARSCDGNHDLSGVIFLPKGQIRGYFQVVHGMTDHIARYEQLMCDLARQGWLCFGHDHLGHGYTARSDEELGYIADRDGHDLLARDVASFYEAVQKEYCTEPFQPYVLMGHSMGSFVVRYAVEHGYIKPDRLIIMGTGGPNPIAGAGLAAANMIKLFCGKRHISPLLEKLAFGNYNKRFSNEDADDPVRWLTTVEENRKAYRADKFCTFKFRVNAMCDLVRIIKLVNKKAWFKAFPKNVPVLLVAGGDDPVGNYGAGVRKVAELLSAQGVAIKCHIYEGARHEILNDTCYEQVREDISAFIM